MIMKNVVLISAVSLLPAVLGVIDLSTYPLSAVLRQGNGEIYTLHWSFNVQEESIRFAVNVSTTGWVGLGLSPDGGMAGSDIVIGWVNSTGQPFLNDHYATTTGWPPMDIRENWFLDEGMENGGFTLLAFHRQWVTCDNHDREIKMDTARVIFSWNEADPVNDDPNEVMYHGPTNRGSISVNLLGGQQDTPPDPVDVQSFTTTVNNITIPGSDTTYWCSVFQLPDEVLQQKRYITKFSPILTGNNELFVHHILVYECDNLNDTYVGHSAPCYLRGGVIDNAVQQCTRGTIIAGWTIGALDFVFPADVAYPIGGLGATRYLVMQTHYDNPGLQSDIIDSSGIEFFYTSVARTHEAGILRLGNTISITMAIPPGASDYNIFGDCSGLCTSEFFPPGGINIFANVLHTHLAGRGVTLRHLRRTQQCGNKLEELEPVEQNLQYDFNYQQYNFLPKIVNVLPGDILRLECKYDTSDRTRIVLGGDSTQEEMCLSFSVYYPRVSLADCTSSVAVTKTAFQPFASNTTFVPSMVLNNILRAAQTRNESNIVSALSEIDWTSDAINSLQLSANKGPFEAICVPRNGSQRHSYMFRNGLPEIQCAYQAPAICDNRSAAGTSYNLLLLVMSLLGSELLLSYWCTC